MTDKVKVLFLESRATKEESPQRFLKGKVYEMPAESAARWVRRNAATDDAELVALAEAQQRKPAEKIGGQVDIPGNWRFFKPDEKIDLARKLGAADDVTAEQAFAMIEAEQAKRAK